MGLIVMTTEALHDQLRVAAEHEAAHAICYLALGYPVYSIEVDPTGLGMTKSHPDPIPIDAFDHAVIHMAGTVIENRYRYISVADRLAEIDGLSAAERAEFDDVGAVHPPYAEAGYRTAELLLKLNADAHRTISDALINGASPMDGDKITKALSDAGIHRYRLPGLGRARQIERSVGR